MSMNLQLPEYVLGIINKFQKKGYEIYIVGGAVRDIIMGKLVYDWDFTTNATPEEILNLFANAYYGNIYGTVGIPPKVKGERPYEITTYRKEFGYSDVRHPDKISWGKTIEEDLSRREATISAMALTIDSKDDKKNAYKKETPSFLLTASPSLILIDPYYGQKDLKLKIFRAVGDPNERYHEDALRMMRAVRISAQLGFKIEDKTLTGIKNNSFLINKIAKERVRDELIKILASPYPSDGIILLRNTGLLEQIIPELEKCFGVEQKSPGRHHIYDVGTHSVLSLKYCPSKDPIVRFATLIHDIGKPITYRKLENGIITFYNHEVVSTKIATRIADRLRFSNKDREKLIKLVRYHQFTVDEKQTDSAIRRFLRNVGLENVPDILDLRVGDRLGGGAQETSWRLEEFKKRLIEVQKQPFTVHDLKINGRDVMKILNISPGPKVGEILQQLYNEVVKKKIANEKKVLIERLGEISPN
jgi:tRNA nucleotidyltransferase (CCA-adding enzyme)